MTSRQHLHSSQPSSELPCTAFPSDVTTIRQHPRKPSKPPNLDISCRTSVWRVLLCRLCRTKKRRWALIGIILAAGIVAGFVAGIVEWKKRDANPISISDLSSDVVLWFNNDLRGAHSPNSDGAVLVNRTMSYADASRNCSSLNEEMLRTDGINTTALFEWLQYPSVSPSQLYWVDGKHDSQCTALSRTGTDATRNCSEQLAALCGSSASISDSVQQDKSAKYQVLVNSKGQELKGYRDKRSFRFFGIRYANAPLRFNHSVEYRVTGLSDATKPGEVCLQGTQGSEDCLFLNIWSLYLPKNGNSSTMLRPVIFWIHGGAFQSDSGTDVTFDGGNLASRGDVVTVTINYRLGNLGFLAINGTSATGNYGLGDQITALDWVRNHIRDFGGNPDRITIAGQSAGAAAVRAMLGSPRAVGKFQAAIMQSNLGGYGFAKPYSSYMSLNEYQTNFTNPILKQVNCDGRASLPCAQKTSASSLITAQPAAFLVQDGIYITSPQLDLSVRSPAAKVPLLMGQMQGDSVFFVDPAPSTGNLTAALQGTPWNSSVLSHLMSFPIITPKSLIMDSKGNFTDPDVIAAVYNVTVEAGNDAMFRCVDQATAFGAATNQIMHPLWYYEMQRAYITYPTRPACNAPIEPGFPNGNPATQIYKCHTGDNIYTFGNLGFTNSPDRDGKDILFAQLAMDSWTAFVRNHDPNPDLTFLKARGYWDTVSAIETSKRWQPVDSKVPVKRMLDTTNIDIGFNEYDQCRDLGLPIDMFK